MDTYLSFLFILAPDEKTYRLTNAFLQFFSYIRGF